MLKAELPSATIAGQAEFLRAGGYTRRYHGWRTLKEDLVGLHSYNVANLVLLLRPDCRKELVVAAVRHDSPEWVTGDPPSTAKRRVPGLKQAYDDYEAEVWCDIGLVDPTGVLTPEEYRVLKLADYLDGMMFCLQERMMGNLLIRAVWAVFVSYMPKLLEASADTAAPEWELFNALQQKWNDNNG